MRKLIFTLLLGNALLGYAWGQKGHDAISYIAEQHLTPTALDSVTNVFDGKSMVYWSNWLDNASHTPEYRYTSTWHYKNIDAGVSYEEAPEAEKGNVITALTEQIAKLQGHNLSHEDAALALKIVVHLMGDLHQPLHMGRLSDRGGNGTSVIFFNHDSNLHSIWDTNVLESGHKWSYSEWQDQLDRLSADEETVIIAGNLDAWGKETHEITVDIYDQTPSDENLSFDYVFKWTPVVEQQFMRAALRLAHVLNTIYDADYSPTAY